MRRPKLMHNSTRALVIGGTQGLGLAVARRLRDEGCTRLVISGRDKAKGEAVAGTIGARFAICDLEDTSSVERLVDVAADQLEGLNALVIAGALTDRGSILDTDHATWDRMITANARSPFFAIQRTAKRAIAAGESASIVNILSMVVHCGQSFLAPYAASKAALANITKNAANGLRIHRTRINGINCGWMDTPGEDAIQRTFHGADDTWLEQAEAKQPFGMLVKPDHVSRLVSFMLSDASGVMTGSIVDFDQNIAGACPE